MNGRVVKNVNIESSRRRRPACETCDAQDDGSDQIIEPFAFRPKYALQTQAVFAYLLVAPHTHR